MNKPPRIDRKELRTPDAFVKKGSTVLGFLLERRSFFVLMLSLTATGVVAFYGYDYWQSKRLTRGWTALHAAEKLDEAKRWEEYKKVYEAHSGLRPGFIAAVRVADHLFDDSRKLSFTDAEKAKPISNESADWYAKARKFSGLLPTEKQLLGINYGSALELGAQMDLAISEFRIAAELPGDARPFALFKLAGAYETHGNVALAESTYLKITVDFASSEYSKLAKNGLRRLKSPSFAPKA